MPAAAGGATGASDYLFLVERMGSDYWSCHYRALQVVEALRLLGREVTMVVTAECPTFQFLRTLVSRGVRVECLAEVEDRDVTFALQPRAPAVAIIMAWFFVTPNLMARAAAACA